MVACPTSKSSAPLSDALQVRQRPHLPERPLRIGIAVPYDLASPAGGVKHHALQLMAALERLGDEVHLIGPASAPLDHPRHHRLAGVVRVPGNGSHSYIGLNVAPWRVWRLLKRLKLDVLHLHEPQMPLVNWWLMWLSPNLPKIGTFHAFGESHTYLRLRKMTSKLLLGRMKRAIAVSRFAGARGAQSYPGLVTTIPNGVNLRLFRPRPTLRPRPAGAPLKLLFVGSLAQSRKGGRVLLEVFERLVEKRVPFHLDWVGDAKDARLLPQHAHLTHHHGLDPETFARLFAENDCLVAPALGQESFGMILVEAMAAGIGIVCSDIEGFADVVRGTAAVRVPPGDADALEEAIVAHSRLTDTERERLRQRQLRSAKTFDWDLLVRQVRAQYLLAGATPAKSAHAGVG